MSQIPILTNEVGSITTYSENNRPTKPNEVTPDTPLELLDLNWREKDLPERERTKHVHRLHPYLGKFIPQLVEVFLRKYFQPGETVLDPFCGSGTTLVQANELGINSVGFDISEFNILLCRAKITTYDVSQVKKEVTDILEKVYQATQRENHQLGLLPKLPVALPSSTDNLYLQQWFAPQSLSELLSYRDYIETESYKYKDLLRVILSRSARSARLTTHFDLDFPKRPQTKPYWCYKHSRECSPTAEAFKFLKRYSLDTLQRIEEFARKRTDASISVFHADTREAKIPPVDGVITSPPYVGLIDYHEQHVYAYNLLGLKDNRDKEIGAASNGANNKAQEKYKQDLAEVFRRSTQSMPSGGRIIVVAHDRTNLYPDIAEHAEVYTEHVLQRHVNRRTGRRSSEFFESIFIWRKP